MRGAETVNDEFEVGFGQDFESHWYRAEQAGRVVMVLFSLAATLSFLGRGPFSHASTRTSEGAMAVDYEPIARHGTSTTTTVHVKIGRCTASQTAPFDLVVLFLFAGITITAVLADDHSMVGAFSGICTIGLMHILASRGKAHFDWFGRIIDGTSVVVFEHGAFNRRRMSRLRRAEQDVMAAARQRGLMRLEQVRYAVAEHDGKISIVQEEAA